MNESFLLILANLIVLVFPSEVTKTDTKILVDGDFNPATQRPNGIKPTTAQVEYKPGVPPDWPARPPKPNRPFWASIFGPRRREIYVLNDTAELPQALLADPNKSGFFDWILNTLGFKPQQQPQSDNLQCRPCSCGQTYKHTRIVGGIETQVNEYPWMVYMTFHGRFYCGGSVINDRYVLTAAHCVSSFSKSALEVVFLDHDRHSDSETKVFKRKIETILRHRSYNVGGNYNNDIALLKLDQVIPFTDIVMPVCLPSGDGGDYAGTLGVVTGWGATKEHGQVSGTLMEVEVPIISNAECKKTKYGSKITDGMMCAGYEEGMRDSCQGDSGGPLHVVKGKVHTVVGVVSWGEGCAQPGYPGVYTRVSRFLHWIKENTRDACYC